MGVNKKYSEMWVLDLCVKLKIQILKYQTSYKYKIFGLQLSIIVTFAFRKYYSRLYYI